VVSHVNVISPVENFLLNPKKKNKRKRILKRKSLKPIRINIEMNPIFKRWRGYESN